MPKAVSQVILWIWITIVLSVLAVLMNKWRGAVSMGEFVFNILTYALFCMFPYKLAKGSNPTRWDLYSGAVVQAGGLGVA